MEKQILEFLKGKLKYDNYGQYLWVVREDGHHQKLADLRGWGAIQHLFEGKKVEINFEKAGKFQDLLGQFIVDAINEKLNRVLPQANVRGELIAFHKWQQNMWTSPNAEITENVVDTYLKAINLP